MLVAALVLASRLPWIAVDYGADPDAYRVVNAARQIAATGRYVESRLPGYPLHEGAMALLVHWGPLASNGLTAMFSVAAAVFLALILRHLNVRGYVLASIAFALTPVVYVSSISSMDYVWAITFVLGATYFVLLRRPLVAGALLGLGIGCRLTSGLMLVPLTALLLAQGRRATRRTDFAIFTAMAMTVGALCFAPVWWRHGLSFLNFKEPPVYPPLEAVVVRATTGVWGTVGTAAGLLTALAMAVRARAIRQWRARSEELAPLLMCAGAIPLYLAAYVRLPLESAYLVPVVPYGLIAVGLAAPERSFRILCAIICLSPFVDIGRKGVTWGGPLLADHARRIDDTRTARAVVAASSRETYAVVVCGSMQPRILALTDSAVAAERHYLYLIDHPRRVTEYLQAGRPVRFIRGADRENLAANGVDLRQLGAEELSTRSLDP